MNQKTFLRNVFERLLRHKLALIGLVIISILLLLAILADIIAPTPYAQNIDAALIPPLKKIYVARSRLMYEKDMYVYEVGDSLKKEYTKPIEINGKVVSVVFKKVDKALQVQIQNGEKKIIPIAPSPQGVLSPYDKIIGEADGFATFVSERSIPAKTFLVKFKPLGEHVLPSKELIGAKLIEVKDWEDLGQAYLVVDKGTGIRHLHAKGASDLTITDEEIGPMGAPLLGTDNLGRDIAQRLVHGSRVSLYVGIVVEIIALLIGIPLGAISGYYGGRIDDWIMRFTDIILSFPGLLFAIAVMAALGRDLINVFIALGVVSWPTIARIVRGQVICLKENEFTEGARAIGCSNARIIMHHIMPNCLAPIIVYTSLGIASSIMSEAGLSFIGIGVRPPMPSWGSIINDGFQYAIYYPHLWIVPGIAIALVVLAFNFLGDGLRDALDPKLKI